MTKAPHSDFARFGSRARRRASAGWRAAACAALLGWAGCTGSITSPWSPATGSTGVDVTNPGDPGSVTPDGSEAALSACLGETSVGPAPLKRLTRVEYRRAVRDVLGVDSAISETFATDERVGGTFASNADAKVASVQLRQYLEAAEQVSASMDVAKLTGCTAAPKDELPCLRSFLARSGRRAFRRPLSSEEQTNFEAAFVELRKQDDFASSLRVVAQALLQSPHFLYHVELDDPAQPMLPGGISRLPDFALAARLSFLLWGSVPDDTLLDAAAAGGLADNEALLTQARRLLADARAKDALATFHSEWLGLDRLEQSTRDPLVYPEWSAALVKDMRSETASFTDFIVRDSRGSFRDLMTTPISFASGTTLDLYGQGEATKDASGGFTLDASKRAGLVTSPAFLAAHSHSNQSSPILRGRAIRERLFCQPLGDPPPEVAAVAPELNPNLTTRERVALHQTTGTACAYCHRLIDGPGFSLEHFDALGRFRDSENTKPIDARFELFNTDVNGSMDGAIELAQRLADSAQARSCYATQWFRYSFGRSEQRADACSVERAVQALDNDGAIAELLLALVASDSFVHKKVEP